MQRILAIGLALSAAGCAAVPAERPAAETVASEADLGERADPFILAISTGRYDYLIELAHEGALLAPATTSGEEETDLSRATRSTLDAARGLYRLRDQVCSTGLASPEDCGALPPPGWFGAPVGEVADVLEINRRLEWLEGAMGPFVGAGCDAGDAYAEPTGLPFFCSVE